MIVIINSITQPIRSIWTHPQPYRKFSPGIRSSSENRFWHAPRLLLSCISGTRPFCKLVALFSKRRQGWSRLPPGRMIHLVPFFSNTVFHAFNLTVQLFQSNLDFFDSLIPLLNMYLYECLYRRQKKGSCYSPFLFRYVVEGYDQWWFTEILYWCYEKSQPQCRRSNMAKFISIEIVQTQYQVRYIVYLPCTERHLHPPNSALSGVYRIFDYSAWWFCNARVDS